jgi:hypothetical protein
MTTPFCTLRIKGSACGAVSSSPSERLLHPILSFPTLFILTMQFTKFASLSVIFFVALFGLVAANPVLERAQSTDAQVNAALATLQKNIAKPIASISSCHLLMLAPDGANSVLSEKVANSTHPTFVSAAPLVSQLIIDLTAASGKIHAIKPSKGGKRQANSDSAASLASIVTVRLSSHISSMFTDAATQEITQATALLGNTKADSIVSSLLPGLDSALDAVLTDVENLLAGVLDLVAQL